MSVAEPVQSVSPRRPHGMIYTVTGTAELDAVGDLLASANKVIGGLQANFKIQSYLDTAIRSLKGRMEGLYVRDEDDRIVSVPEVLFPVEWARLKSRPVNARTIGGLTNAFPVPDMASVVYAVATDPSTMSVDEMLHRYRNWVTDGISAAATDALATPQLSKNLENGERAAALHGALVSVFNVSLSLHSLCTICPDLKKELRDLRERTGYLTEIKRYGDDLMTDGIEPVLWSIAYQRSKFQGARAKEPRPYQKAIYTSRSSPIRIFEEKYGSFFNPEQRFGLAQISRSLPKKELYSAKLNRLLRTLIQSVQKDPPEFIVVVADNTILARYIHRVLQTADVSTPEMQQAALLLSGSTPKQMQGVVDGVNKGAVRVLVTTEKTTMPKMSPQDRDVHIIPWGQHDTSLSRYPVVRDFVGQFEGKTTPILAQGTADVFQRRRAKKYAQGPSVVTQGRIIEDAPEIPPYVRQIHPAVITFEQRFETALKRMRAFYLSKGFVPEDLFELYCQSAERELRHLGKQIGGDRTAMKDARRVFRKVAWRNLYDCQSGNVPQSEYDIPYILHLHRQLRGLVSQASEPQKHNLTILYYQTFADTLGAVYDRPQFTRRGQDPLKVAYPSRATRLALQSQLEEGAQWIITTNNEAATHTRSARNRIARRLENLASALN